MPHVQLPEDEGPRSYRNRDGLTVAEGETVEVDADTAAYLVAEHGFEHVDDATGDGDADGDVHEEDGPPDDAVEPPFDPSDHTVAELDDALADAELSDAEREALLAAEREGDDRTGAVDAIEEA